MADLRGRRPTWGDYTKLRNAVEEYFEMRDKQDKFPDYAGMLIFLQIDDDDVAALVAEDNPNAKEYRRIFKYAKLRRESWLATTMVSDPKRASGCMNALKQHENGGYENRGSDKGEKKLLIKIDGIGGGMNAMK